MVDTTKVISVLVAIPTRYDQVAMVDNIKVDTVMVAIL